MARTSVCGPGTYDLRFANVNRQLTLWVGGSVVSFQAAPGAEAVQDGQSPTAYKGELLDNDVPTAYDLAPVRIGSRVRPGGQPPADRPRHLLPGDQQQAQRRRADDGLHGPICPRTLSQGPGHG